MPNDSRSNEPTTIFLLHYLGGSALTWRWVVARLPPSVHVVAIDLPGFGDRSHSDGFSVAEMAAAVIDRVRAERSPNWILVGHSMGAKIAMAVARQAEDGDATLAGLRHLILLAGSPPGPEPMEESQRQKMSGWFLGDAEKSRAEANLFIEQNVSSPLANDPHLQAVSDLLRAARPAWEAWLHGGSLEDIQAQIGILQTPALIIAGSKDENLGVDAQQRLVASHFAHHQVKVLDGAKHLLPLERPEEIAKLINATIGNVPVTEIPSLYRELIDSDRVSKKTREALQGRAEPESPDVAAKVLTVRQMALLRAALARIVPQPYEVPIDLAVRIDSMLAEGTGDGWRVATQPPDVEAYRAGLDALDGTDRPFDTLRTDEQDKILQSVQAGQQPDGRMTAAQMSVWFTDLCADAVRLYVAHPATLARIGFSGIGYGGDTERLPGFKEVGIGMKEPWEPRAEQ
jgi:pimeloyl-ACP methyl ester carboxylesterase